MGYKLKYRGSFSKQIHLVGKRFRLEIRQNTTNAYVFFKNRDEGSYQLSHAYDRFFGTSSSSSRPAKNWKN